MRGLLIWGVVYSSKAMWPPSSLPVARQNVKAQAISKTCENGRNPADLIELRARALMNLSKRHGNTGTGHRDPASAPPY